MVNVRVRAPKIIGSMKRDFLATGRQPAGVCCAALTLATRVNRIERSKEEIRKVLHVRFCFGLSFQHLQALIPLLLYFFANVFML